MCWGNSDALVEIRCFSGSALFLLLNTYLSFAVLSGSITNNKDNTACYFTVEDSSEFTDINCSSTVNK